MEINSVNAYLLALSKVEGVGPITAKNLISYCGGIKAVFKSSKTKLMKVPGVKEKISSEILNQNPEEILAKEIPVLNKNNIEIVSFLDQNYPKRLHQIDQAPLFLYTKGKVELNPNRTVAMIGTRKASPYGKLMCEQIVEGLKPYEVTIVSGLAYGIDTCSHKMAVKNNISTIGVLGHGLDQIYPPENRKLSEKMEANGGLITEFHYGSKMNPKNFPSRNRIIAGFADAVIVVESGEKGGSIITAEFANAYNKDVFAVPGNCNKSQAKGCNKLIKTNKAHLMESADDLAYIMSWDKDQENAKAIQRQLFFEFDEEQKKIYQAIKENGEMGLDTLHILLNLPLSQLSSKLLTMEFQGAIKSMPGKRYILYK